MMEKERKSDLIIGIDPDCDLSGVATYNPDTKTLWADTLPFPLLIDFIDFKAKSLREQGRDIIVVVECSWASSHNWHLAPRDTKSVAARKGYDEGRNHEVGKKIVEMLTHHNIKVREKTPLKKVWRTKDRKISHELLMQLAENAGLKVAFNRSNQEKRDAALLALNEANIPLRIHVQR